MRYITFVLALCGFYALLSGQFHNTFLMAVGAGCIALIVFLSARMALVDEESYPGNGVILRALFYAPYLVWQVILSNIDVLKRALSPALPVAPRMVEIPYSTRTAFGTVTFANSITLTPGTVTVEVGEDTMLIHALTAEAAEGVKDGSMEAQVKRLEGTK
ncbi:MAG: Na+/H+ antiporter subunit E [Myxococcales bacterium]|nr:Na+/H+ antiporter subunit E [Myxococcales bacterium]MCB9702362.1 Na+/H+ antiporter subunit E [Myxococcales bacterium]